MLIKQKNKKAALSKRHRKSKWNETLLPYLLIAPAMITLFIFTLYPAVDLVRLSFRNYDMISVDEFIGLKNYRQLFFVNKDFIKALKNTLNYTVWSVVLLIVIGLLLALWVQKGSKLNGASQRIMFFPHICSMLSITLIFQWLMNRDSGLFNQILEAVGLPTLKWMDSSSTAMGSIIFISVWKNVGYYALVLLSALKGIPTEINEAAALDNVNPIRKFVKITFPMLSPQIFFLLVTITIGSFKVFESVRILTDGGPGNATDVVVLYIYKYAFTNLRVGYAAAAGTVLLVILLALTFVYFRVLDKKVHYQ